MTSLTEHLRRMVLRDGAGLGDDELLASFIERHDEAALAALVRRHGPMVWGVCRRLLAHHDAEDAFQATFLVLVRKATSVVPRAMVANWLYGVAHQTALQARRTTARRRAKEVQVTQMPDAEAVQQDQWSDLQPILDEELNHLPDIYRAVIVLCDLESRTRREVARQLGVPEGTVGGRLARARVLLAKRLDQRGLVLSGGALATILSQNAASAGASASVVSNTIRVASLTATGQATAGVISVTVAALTEGVLKAMLVCKLKSVVGTLMLVAVLAGGGVAISLGQPPDSPKTKKADPEPKKDAVARELNLLSTYGTIDHLIILIRRQQLQAEIDRLQAELPSLPAGTQLSVALAESDLPVAAGDLQTLLGPLARIRFGEKPAEWLTVRMNGKGAILDGEAAAVYWAVGVIKQLVPRKPDRAGQLTAIREEYAKAREEFGKTIQAGTIKPDADGEYPGWAELVKRFTKQAHEVIDADPVDAVGLEALLFCLYDLGAGEFEPALYQLVLKHHVASEKIDPLVRQRTAPADFLRGVAARSPHTRIRLWANYHLAENLYRGGKPKDAEPLLETLAADAEAKDQGGYTLGTLADTASRLLFEIRRLNVGQAVPEIDGADLDGKPIKLSQFRGKVTLLVFWATWCGPCMAMVPHERALAERFADKPFAVVGVNGDILPIKDIRVMGPDGKPIDDSARVKAALEKHKIPWPSFRSGQIGVATEWNVRSWPTVYLIDHHGVIRGKWKGDPGAKLLDRAVEELVHTAVAEQTNSGK